LPQSKRHRAFWCAKRAWLFLAPSGMSAIAAAGTSEPVASEQARLARLQATAD